MLAPELAQALLPTLTFVLITLGAVKVPASMKNLHFTSNCYDYNSTDSLPEALLDAVLPTERQRGRQT